MVLPSTPVMFHHKKGEIGFVRDPVLKKKIPEVSVLH
jgi:hypothetical protein